MALLHAITLMNQKLKITFVLPTAGTFPIGGFKVVYEYANHLARRDHSVTVVHPAQLPANMPWIGRAKAAVRYIQRNIDGSYRPNKWFQVDPKVRLMWVWSLAERYIPDADVVVATWWETAEFVNSYSRTKGRPSYLIQHLETWMGREDRVYATWKMPLKKVVIAQWLKDIADGMGESSTLIPNGLDFKKFGMDVPPPNRNNSQCMMLYHTMDWKGSADGLDALSIVKQQVPELRATLFGTPSAPANLPEWIEYHQNPPQTVLRELYNQAAIFLAPSWAEGWPLPPAEAMMCGAALVATDIGGHREYAIHEETALLSPPKDAKGLAENILRLMCDQDLRIRLAHQGNAHIQQFTWDRAVDRFEAALLEG
jgi:glycosyltransferase involved in cell wall biosynthesis